MKRLIVTADDVGLDRGMTEGAIRAHRDGIVTACSLVANGREFDDAVTRLRVTPSLEVGVHLALVEERALTTNELMPSGYVRFLLSKRTLDVERELRAQIEKVLDTGLPITHLNGHQHLHAWPPVFRIVTRLAREYDIGHVRVARDWGGRAPVVRQAAVAALSLLATGKGRTIGIAEAGHLTAERIVQLFECVDELTELVTHPGVDVRGYAHWGYAWDEETRALCDSRVSNAIAQHEIRLVAPSNI